MTTYFITRHRGAHEWAEQQGFHVDQRLDHLDIAIIKPGDKVLGTLPVHLAAAICEHGARYFHLSIESPPERRGGEFTPEEMRAFGARLEEYSIKRIKDLI